MAGPGASVVLPDLLSDELGLQIKEELGRIADEVRGDDFWIDGRPFIVTFGEDYPGELDDLAREGFPTILGWTPKAVVGFAAMYNSDEDHRVLALICIRLVKTLRGVIDLNGSISAGPSLSRTAPAAPIRVEPFGEGHGVLLANSYLISDGRYGTAHYCDADFLERWMNDPAFRMVK